MSSLRISPPKRTSPAPGGRSPPGSATQASQVSDIYKGSLNSEFLCNEISYLAGKVKKVLTTLTKMHLTNEIFLKDFVVTKDLKIMQENLKNYQEFVRHFLTFLPFYGRFGCFDSFRMTLRWRAAWKTSIACRMTSWGT